MGCQGCGRRRQRRCGARRSAGRRCRSEGTWSTRLGIAAHAAAVPQGQLPFGAAVKLRRLHVAPWWCADVMRCTTLCVRHDVMAAVKSLAPTRSSAPYVYRVFTACIPHAHRACPKPTASVKSPKLGAAVGRPTAGMHGIVPDSQPCSSSSSATSHPSPHSAELHTSAIAHHAVKRTAKRFTRATMGAMRESGPPTRWIELAGTIMSLPHAPRRQSACCSRDRAAVFRKQLAAEIAREVLLELDAMMVAAQRGSPSTVTWSTLSYSAPASYVL